MDVGISLDSLSLRRGIIYNEIFTPELIRFLGVVKESRVSIIDEVSTCEDARGSHA